VALRCTDSRADVFFVVRRPDCCSVLEVGSDEGAVEGPARIDGPVPESPLQVTEDGGGLVGLDSNVSGEFQVTREGDSEVLFRFDIIQSAAAFGLTHEEIRVYLFTVASAEVHHLTFVDVEEQ